MKKTYTAPQAQVVRLQMEAQILGASKVYNEVSTSGQLSEERSWSDDWNDVEED